MKYLIIAVMLILILTGCGAWDRGVATWTGYSKVCVEGITYIQFTSGTTVQVDKEGKPVPCSSTL